jgi:hypothetical protein
MIDRIINNLKERRERVLNGEINCIPSAFTRFRDDFVGIEQGKYFLVSGQTKAAKTQIATNMFMYNPLFYAYENPDKIHLKIFYFPLEESVENITLRFMSHLLSKYSNYRISPLDLKSTNENKIVPIEALELLETDHYKNILKFYEDTVMYFEDRNATGIYKQIKSYAEKNGVIHKKKITITNKETGVSEEREVFDYYEPHDPKEYVIIIIDHISLISPEGGMDLRESINRLSEYMIMFRNRYNYIPVIIQQQGTETGNLDAFKNNKIRPTMAGLSDSKYTAKDCSMMLGITNPYSHELDNYLGYDIRKFKDSIRFLEVVLNREGQSNGIIALYFDGKTCTFKELPPPNDKEALEKVYNYLDKIRKTNKVFMFFKKLFNKKNG